MTGPLNGIRLIELASLGPAPFAAMALADAGADVVRVDRLEEADGEPRSIGGTSNFMHRGRTSITLDLKSSVGVDAFMSMVEQADGLIEGYRPGVVERLGVGPEQCALRNSRLVFGRVTGFGRLGPYASQSGHDLNYIAMSGSLGAIGEEGSPPTPPLNLLGDFGGGGLLLAFGMACALLEARESGQGQVVDAAMIDGAAYLATFIHGMRASGRWNDTRGSNIIDGAAPFYQVYETQDHQYVAVGAVEERFFRRLLVGLGLDPDSLGPLQDRDNWPILKEQMRDIFLSRTREEWEAQLSGIDACFSPVLSLAEAPNHPHNMSWGTFTEFAGQLQPSPAPRFSRTPSEIISPPPSVGEGGLAALQRWGLKPEAVDTIAVASRASFKSPPRQAQP